MGRDRRGVALFTALWLVVAIGVVGLQFSLEARERRLAAANTVEIAQSRAAALAGIEHAQARLERLTRQPVLQSGQPGSRALDTWLDADTLVRIDGEVGGARYEVRVRETGSGLNLNRATEDQLRLLLTRLGFDYSLADELAQCIMDWRDVDVMHRARGAERERYVAEGRMMLPRDGEFQDIPELLHVMHMTPEIYDSIAPFLVLTGDGRINVNTAPAPVLATIPGLGDAGVAIIIRTREANRRIALVNELRALVGASTASLPDNRVAFEVRAMTVTSTGWNQGGRTPVRVEAVVSRSGLNARTTSVGPRKTW
jgi:general secretion pathway protein K